MSQDGGWVKGLRRDHLKNATTIIAAGEWIKCYKATEYIQNTKAAMITLSLEAAENDITVHKIDEV